MAKDVILGIVMIFVFAIAFFSFHFMFNQVADKLINNTVVNSSAAAVQAFQDGKTLSNRMDYIIFIVFIAVTLGLIITGWLIGGSPILMFVYFLVMVVATILASIFNYVWESVSQASIFGTHVLYFPITNHILTHIEIYTPVIGFLAVIAMFVKPFLVRQE